MLSIRLRVFSRRKHRKPTRKEKKIFTPSHQKIHEDINLTLGQPLRITENFQIFWSLFCAQPSLVLQLNALRTNNHSPPTFA
jgi:hypothetical protein